MVGYSGGQMLGNVPTYMQATGKSRARSSISASTPARRSSGLSRWLGAARAADQQPFLQGYLPILNLCHRIVLGLGADVDTGAGFVTPENYHMVAKLAEQGLR